MHLADKFLHSIPCVFLLLHCDRACPLARFLRRLLSLRTGSADYAIVMAQSSLIGSILERKPTAKPSNPFQATTKTGFPAVQHRSQSAFARARRDGSKPGTERLREVPVVQSSVQPSQHKPFSGPSNADDWRAQMEEDNRKQVASMTEEERDQERAEIFGKFGSNVVDVLRKARAAREGKVVAGGSETPEVGVSPSPPSSPSRPRIGERTRSHSMYISSRVMDWIYDHSFRQSHKAVFPPIHICRQHSTAKPR